MSTQDQFFVKLPRGTRSPPAAFNRVLLVPSAWDDFSFKTSFAAYYFSPSGSRTELGTVKLGRFGQMHGWSFDQLEESFESLGDSWFSLGQDVDYYSHLAALPPDVSQRILTGLRDIVIDEALRLRAEGEDVFKDSLMRGVSESVILGQYRRVLRGEPPLTDYSFAYVEPGGGERAAFRLRFSVDAGSKPSTNIHVLIGRNGVGKTTLLNQMVNSIVRSEADPSDRGFRLAGGWVGLGSPLPQDYFSSVVSVSFSAFDPFVPPADRPDRTVGPAYFYIGMKRRTPPASELRSLKDSEDLVADFRAGFEACLSQSAKRTRWANAIRRLESDVNFQQRELTSLLAHEDTHAISLACEQLETMSSGHQIVMLTITQLVATVEEKTLVLLDEPESHLHPPLLSAFVRALSDLLHNRNAVAIVATHSPVVLQEVPKSCVSKLTRAGSQARVDPPGLETFGENVGTLTREVFGLEVSKSGFHDLLEADVATGATYEQIVGSYEGQLGLEGRSVLKALVVARDASRG